MDDENYSLSDSLKQNSRYKIYIWISGPINGAKDHMGGNHIFIYHRIAELL